MNMKVVKCDIPTAYKIKYSNDLNAALTSWEGMTNLYDPVKECTSCNGFIGTATGTTAFNLSQTRLIFVSMVLFALVLLFL